MRYTGVKLARVLADNSVLPLVERVAPDPEEDLYVRLEALAYLAAVGGASVETVFRPFLQSSDNQIRLEAVISIGEVANSAAVKELTAILQDVNQPLFLRSACAWCLGRIGTADAQSSLCAAFADVKLGIREDALEAIVNIGEAAYPTLKKSLFDRQEDIAAGCAEALRQADASGTKMILELVSALRDKAASPWVVWLIGQLPSEEVSAAIAEMEDVDPRIHYAISLLWGFARSWIARRWELAPNAHRERWDVS